MDINNAVDAARLVSAGLDRLAADRSDRYPREMSDLCLRVLRALTGVRFDHPKDRAYHYQLMNPDLTYAATLLSNGIRVDSRLIKGFFEFSVTEVSSGFGYAIKLPYDQSIAAQINLGTTTVH